MAITPIRINQIVSKNPKDPISAQDWNDILNMLIEQNNLLSDQLVALQATIQATTVDTINSMIASGTLTLNVDASKLGGLVATDYVTQTNLAALNTAIAATYATNTALESAKTNITTLQNSMTTAQADITTLKSKAHTLYKGNAGPTAGTGIDNDVYLQY